MKPARVFLVLESATSVWGRSGLRSRDPTVLSLGANRESRLLGGQGPPTNPATRRLHRSEPAGFVSDNRARRASRARSRTRGYVDTWCDSVSHVRPP